MYSWKHWVEKCSHLNVMTDEKYLNSYTKNITKKDIELLTDRFKKIKEHYDLKDDVYLCSNKLKIISEVLNKNIKLTKINKYKQIKLECNNKEYILNTFKDVVLCNFFIKDHNIYGIDFLK